MKSYRELAVWQKAMDFVDLVYTVQRKFPREELYGLGDQLRRSAVSIPSNIAEGFGRETHADFAHFLAQARGSLFEAETQLEIACRNGFISEDQTLKVQSEELSKMLSSLIRKLRTSPTPATHSALSTKHSAQSTRH